MLLSIYQEHTLKRHTLSRREILENCIGRGLLLASIPMSSTSLFALWQQGEKMAAKDRKSVV